jgi:tetratricopeptide (TPR) repeat protein
VGKRASVWLVVIGVAVISYGVFESRVPDIRLPEAPPPDRPAPADPAPRPDFAAIRAAEALADPLARCRGVPQPHGWHWPAATIDAFCADAVIPVMQYAAADAGKFDARLELLTDAYFAGKLAEGVYWATYTRNFADSGAAVARLVDAWLRQSPGSSHAHTASALHHAGQASAHRGVLPLDEMPQTDRDRMLAEAELATRAARRAIEHDPRSLPAYKALLTVARLRGDRELAQTAARDALAMRPDSYYLREEMMLAATPDWGGSQQQLDAIATQAQAHAAANPRLVALLATAAGHEAMLRWRDARYPQAVRLYEAALAHGPDLRYLEQAHDALLRTGDRVRAVEVMSQILRLRPGVSDARAARAEQLLQLKETEWAQAEFEAMSATGPAPEKH